MKKSVKIFLIVIGIVVAIILIFFALMGYIPGLSALFGATKPRDLGVTYTDADQKSARDKGQVEWETLSANTSDDQSIQFTGSHEVNNSWNSAEMTALLNDRPWKYWPINTVQMRINPDGTAEMSGVVNSSKLRGYASGIGVPAVVADRISILPAQAAFYIKGTGALSENSVSKFDITSAQLGRLSIPTGVLLSRNSLGAKTAFAQNVVSELEKYSGKKAAIVNFINGRLSWISGFFAKKAHVSDSKLFFEGTLPDKERSAR